MALGGDSDQQRYDHILAKYQRYLIHNNRTKVTNTFIFLENRSGISLNTPLFSMQMSSPSWIAEFIGTESLKKPAKLGNRCVTSKDERAFYWIPSNTHLVA